MSVTKPLPCSMSPLCRLMLGFPGSMLYAEVEVIITSTMNDIKLKHKCEVSRCLMSDSLAQRHALYSNAHFNNVALGKHFFK